MVRIQACEQEYGLCSPCLPNLDNVIPPIFITSQNGPTKGVRFGQGQLQLCTHNFKRRFVRLDLAKEWQVCLVPFLICRWEV